MKAEKIQQGNSGKLILFFAGWGMDIHPFLRLQSQNADVLIVYDYTDLSFELSLIRGYDEIHLIAWSMGVWAASEVLGDVVLASAVAVNGTPYPIHDAWGIPEAVVEGTLANLSEEGIRRFNRRMCGSVEILTQFLLFPVIRSVEDRKEELLQITRHVFAVQDRVRWTKAIVSSSDRIYPCANQAAYWSTRVPVLYLDAPHYPFYLWNEWTEIVCL